MSWLPVAIRKLLPGWRANGTEAFRLDGRRPGASSVVVCVGDSITQGDVSTDWVRVLDERLRPSGFQFVNAGVNGNLAFDIAGRLDEVVACRPDVVTLLVGTNDVNARFDASWEARYRKDNRLPVAPDLAFYTSNLDRIFTRVRAETSARVVALDVPMLGEDLDSRMNGLVAEYNDALRRVAERHAVPVLPLNARLRAALPAGHQPPPYAGKTGPVVLAALRARLLRRGWDAASRAAGLALLTDHIHINDTAGAILADLVERSICAGTSAIPS